jgi:hypothetical protein
MAKKKRSEMTPEELIKARAKDRKDDANRRNNPKRIEYNKKRRSTIEWKARQHQYQIKRRSNLEGKLEHCEYEAKRIATPHGMKVHLESTSKYRKSLHGKAVRRSANIAIKYGVDSSFIYEKWLGQNGKCAICKADLPSIEEVHIDHDHNVLKPLWIRDLLCFKCNPMLGMAKESPAILRAAALYIEQWNSVLHARGVKSEREATTNPVLVVN